MPYTLQRTPLRLARKNTSFLFRFAQIELQHDEHRQRNAWQNNRERAEAPAPPYALVEPLARFRSRERNDNVRRAREREREASISKTRCVGCNHIDGVYDAGKTNRVENLRSAKDGESAGAGHEHEAERWKRDHQGETLSTTPEVKNFGHRYVGCRGHAGGNYGDDGEEGVFFPFAGDVRGEVAEDRGLEAIDEVEEPHAIWWIRHQNASTFRGVELT